MIKKTKEKIAVMQDVATIFVCDICKKEFNPETDVMETQEFHHIRFTGGYGSVFGDMNKVECDICQTCLKEKLGEFLRFPDQEGEEEFVLFWGGKFSQWYKAPMIINGIEYNCCEQYMMAEKARLFEDKEALKEIMATKDPRKQKAIGRKVKNFDQEKWEGIARSVVYKANYAKFSQNEDCFKELDEKYGKMKIFEDKGFRYLHREREHLPTFKRDKKRLYKRAKIRRKEDINLLFHIMARRIEAWWD
ncbi:MAG: NADAR family protein [Flavobacteriaceae bacterium]|nr:NADAR family protein [Flavobacteriaceae bacterium]